MLLQPTGPEPSVSRDDSVAYWELRGKGAVKFRSEVFYTIAPLPYYIDRRARVFRYLLTLCANPGTQQAGRCVVDFGCGDGYWLARLGECYPSLDLIGVDPIAAMRERAREACPRAIVLSDLSEVRRQPDVLYSVAVLAHILDDLKVTALFEQWHELLANSGLALVFEQTGPRRTVSSTSVRRKCTWYRDGLKAAGFEIESEILFYYPAHRLFERYVARPIYWFIQQIGGGRTDTEARLFANRLSMFRYMSQAAVQMSTRVERSPDPEKWGYSLIVARKK